MATCSAGWQHGPTRESAAWTVASDLPGRLRIKHPELINSNLLRHHCRLVLTSCHWLVRFRINGLAGSVCIDYPLHRRAELNAVLEQALTLSTVEERFEPLPSPPFSGQRVRRIVLHGGTCLALLSLESAVALPAVAMAGVTALLLWPLAREVLQQLRHRRVGVEALELSFSGVLVSQGLTAEALLDLAIGDAVEATQNAVERDDLKLDSDHLLDRLGEAVVVSEITANGEVVRRSLKEINAGMTVRLSAQQHSFLSARLRSGQLIVINRLVDGDWRPVRLGLGDRVEPGALVISGAAELTTEACIGSDQAYDLLRQHHARIDPEPQGAELWVNRYKSVMPTLLLGLGGSFLMSGSLDRALAALQFNPVSDWETQKLAAQLTAIADLNLHRLRIRHPQAIATIGRIRHLVISRSCLDRIGGIQVRERLNSTTHTPTGSLVQLLAGVQRWICGVDGTAIWSQQLQQVAAAVPIRRVDIGNLQEGWTIESNDGRQWLLTQGRGDTNRSQHPHDVPLEIWQQGTCLGTVELIREPDQHWIETCASLRHLGITVHLIASEAVERLDDIAAVLGVAREHQHGSCTASERLQLIEELQQRGEAVGFVGYVVHDLPALAQADVSIGLEVDDDSRYLSGICDLSLGADAQWLPRLINISRSMERASSQNLTLLGASQMLSSLATAAGLIAPLETVLVADIPLLLAELNNLIALRKPKPVQPDHHPASGGAAQATQGS